MAEPTPFEIYVKEFELRLKLIETVGKWNKDMADAEVQWANARVIHAKAAMIERINRELFIAMQQLKREERVAKDRVSRARNDAGKTRILVSARKPSDAIGFSQAWSAFDYFLGESASDAVLEAIELPVGPSHRKGANFVSVLVNGQVTDAPAETENFGLLKGWMQANYLFFKSGTPPHIVTVKAMKTINQSRKEVIEGLEEQLANTQTQNYDKLSQLRSFLGLPAAAEKTPVTPK